ncbi:MAG TPA: serine hydrolase domain-containing protein [Anaerolineales bacterium]|nr:serine hydrolase domain-containing protein [Anaerolineales bacterium]
MKISTFHKPALKVLGLVLLLLIGLMLLTGDVGKDALASPMSLIGTGSQNMDHVSVSRDLEEFTDEMIIRQLDEYQIAGATVSIIQDGKIVLAKGYGYADIEEQVPVSPDETIFRIGSTSKLFTWTAIMQLAEQGEIDLNADVNTYLPDFQIPATFPKPITLLDLMSHTAGFEERTTGTEAARAAEMISLHDYLVTYMPDRVRPPGELSTYSNYGAALAGYIVEVVSGMPFEQYIETFIFEPLSMAHSTFRQPLPLDLADHLATSYSYNGGFGKGVFSYPNLLPAATMSSTARDMANFIIAQLQSGRFENNKILKPETVALMHTQSFTNDKRLDGFAHGFMEETKNGIRVLWHGGDIGNWHSILAIIPDKNLGFFIGYNSNESIQAVNETYYAILNTYFPSHNNSEQPPIVMLSQDSVDISGEYRSTRSFYNHVERVTSFPGKGNFQITQAQSNTISIQGLKFYQIEPLVFSSLDGTGTLIFHLDGKSIHMHENGNPLFAYERVDWYEALTFNVVMLGICYALLFTVILAAVIGIFRRKNDVDPRAHLPRIARVWALVLSLIFLLAPAAVWIYMQFYFKLPFPFYMVIILAIILAASALVIGPVIFTVFAWARRCWSVAGRLHYTFITFALLGMVWLMYYWRLLGFRY